MLSQALNLYKQGRINEALLILEKLVKNKKTNIEELNVYAALLFEKNNFKEAISIISKALIINPKNIVLLNNRAQFYFKIKKYEDSLNDFNQILKINPYHDETYNDIGRIYVKKNNFLDGIFYFDKAIKINQNKYQYFYNKGNALYRLNKFEDSINSYNESIKLKTDHYKSYHNRGLSLQELLKLDEAMNDFESAIKYSKNFYESHLAKGYIHLIKGEFEQGWKLHEYRWKSDMFNEYLPKNKNSKLWLGQENLKSKSILLFHEQGLGDTIQFARYIKNFKTLDTKVIVLVQKPLLKIIKTVEPSFDYITEEKDGLCYDYHCPLMSLPLAFNTTINNIPKTTPYLSAPQQTVIEFKDKLSSVNKTKIGIAWRGNPNHKNDHQRSIELSDIVALLDKKYHWVILQNKLNEKEDKILEKNSITYFKINNFSELSGICKNLDFIISVDTSVAHLGGALGKKVILLTPYFCDFRWLLNTSKTDWYPTMRIIRKEKNQNWKFAFIEGLKLIDNL